MNDISLEDRVLKLVYAPDYRPTKPRGLRQLLKLSEDDNAALRRTIKRLVRTGRLGYAANHLVVPIDQVPKGDPHLVEGTFRIASAGYGFLRPLGEHRDKFDEDIFIPAKYVGTAMSGDTPSRPRSPWTGRPIRRHDSRNRRTAETTISRDLSDP